jgi:hypothetical protein
MKHSNVNLACRKMLTEHGNTPNEHPILAQNPDKQGHLTKRALSSDSDINISYQKNKMLI